MRRLRKSNRDKFLFGVAGGLGEYLEIDPALMRVGFVILCFAGGTGLVLYAVLALVLPARPNADVRPSGASASAPVPEDVAGASRFRSDADADEADTGPRRTGIAVALIAFGTLVLLGQLGIFDWFRFDLLWPLILIGFGIAMLVSGRSRSS